MGYDEADEREGGMYFFSSTAWHDMAWHDKATRFSLQSTEDGAETFVENRAGIKLV
jgi:hypothetical protein